MKLKKTLCAICGTNEATTKDHIPPKSLYPTPRDNDINLNTVPACKACNNGASSDDEVFKVLVGIDTGEHQGSPQKIIDSLAKTISKNGRVARQIFASNERIYTKLNGPLLEPAVAVTFDFEQYERVINRIICGLYWMETGRAMPSEATVQVLPGNQIQQSLAVEIMELMHQLPLRKLNKETFAYRCHIPSEGTQAWGMQFFGRHTTFAFVSPPSAAAD